MEIVGTEKTVGTRIVGTAQTVVGTAIVGNGNAIPPSGKVEQVENRTDDGAGL